MAELSEVIKSENLIGKRIDVTDLSFYPMRGIQYDVSRESYGFRCRNAPKCYGDQGNQHDGSFSAVPVFDTYLKLMQLEQGNIQGLLDVGAFLPNKIDLEFEKWGEGSISKFRKLLFYRLDRGVSREDMSKFTVPITSVGYYFSGNRVQFNSDGEEFARWTLHCNLSD